MHSILKDILEKTRVDLARRKDEIPLETLKKTVFSTTPATRFKNAIVAPKKGSMALIAEIKLASPTTGDLGTAAEITSRALRYENAGADALSLVTEKHFFKGSMESIARVKQVSQLPILQKDFIIDSYQIYEAKKAGADGLLLIAKLVARDELASFVDLALQLGVEPVVEINDEEDLEKAVATTTRIIAVNARNLDSFELDVDAACKLLTKIPDTFVKLGFSGIHTSMQVEKYRKAGAKGVLVGTSLMKAEDVASFVKELMV